MPYTVAGEGYQHIIALVGEVYCHHYRFIIQVSLEHNYLAVGIGIKMEEIPALD